MEKQTKPRPKEGSHRPLPQTIDAQLLQEAGFIQSIIAHQSLFPLMDHWANLIYEFTDRDLTDIKVALMELVNAAVCRPGSKAQALFSFHKDYPAAYLPDEVPGVHVYCMYRVDGETKEYKFEISLTEDNPKETKYVDQFLMLNATAEDAHHLIDQVCKGMGFPYHSKYDADKLWEIMLRRACPPWERATYHFGTLFLPNGIDFWETQEVDGPNDMANLLKTSGVAVVTHGTDQPDHYVFNIFIRRAAK